MKKAFKIIAVLAALFIGFIVYIGSGYGEKIEFDGTDVYYTEMVEEGEAQKLGEYLVESGFTDGSAKSVQLSKRDSVYLFRMVVLEGTTKDSTNDFTFEAMALAISWKVFDQQPVELEACDNTFETLRVYGKR